MTTIILISILTFFGLWYYFQDLKISLSGLLITFFISVAVRHIWHKNESPPIGGE